MEDIDGCRQFGVGAKLLVRHASNSVGFVKRVVGGGVLYDAADAQ